MEASGAGDNAASGQRGQIGRQTFDMARELIDQGKKPTEAFTIVAERTGRSAATVATAYYRIARTMPGGAGVKQRSRSRAGTATRAPRGTAAATTRRSSGGSSTSQLVQQLIDAANALGQHVERLERENAEYRNITDALDRLKRG